MTDTTSVGCLALCGHSRKLLCTAACGQEMPTGAELLRRVRSVVSKGPQYDAGGFVYMTIRLTYGEKRADERSRTAGLLITSDNSGVAGDCKGLQIVRI
jgi:hypothetical protein